MNIVLTSSPVWLEGIERIKKVHPGNPLHDLKPAGKSWAVDNFNTLEGWKIVQGGDNEIERQEDFTPGDFVIDIVKNYKGHDACLKVSLSAHNKTHPHQVPYVVLRRESPIKISGQPKSIGAWVYGNSGWGRISYELIDAKGERWTSALGSGGTGSEGWVHGEWFGAYSFINFDGWRYVEVPLPLSISGTFPKPFFELKKGEDIYVRSVKEYKEYEMTRRHQVWGTWKHHGGDGILDYPVSLAGLVFEQRSHLIYAGKLVPVKNKSYYIDSIVVSDKVIQRDTRVDEDAIVDDWNVWIEKDK